MSTKWKLPSTEGAIAALLAAALVPALSGTAAAAQDNDGAQSSAGPVIEEVVVTAQKRAENIQNVPIAITALSSRTLERSGVGSNVMNLQMVTPGLQTEQVVVGFVPRIRGVGSSDTTVGNENSVAVYLDGVYLPGTAAGLLSLSNIERVEVLKGPQGTLFGRNATGGVIRVITKEPTHEPSGNFSFTYGNYDTKTLSGYGSIGLTEDIATSLAVRWDKQGTGWGHNIFTGRQVYKHETIALRNQWLFTPDANTKIVIAGDYYKNHNNASPYRVQIPSGFYDYSQTFPSHMQGWTWGVNARIEHEFDFAKLVSITSYRKVKQTNVIDADYMAADLLDTYYVGRSKTMTQELRLLSPDSSKLKWIVGGFFMDRTAGFVPSQQMGPFYALIGLSGIAAFTQQRTTSLAGFAQATYPVFSDTNLTLGLRYTADKQKFNGFTLSYPLGGVPPFVKTGVQNSSRKAYRMTYRVVVDHHFAKHLMAYASWNTGFKSGYYGLLTSPSSSSAPEYLTAYEIGMKSDLLDGRLRLNASAYRYDISNLQTFFETGTGQAEVINAGNAQIEGLEVDATAIPLDNVTLNFGASYMPRAKYTKFVPCPGPTIPFLFPPAVYNCSGSRMVDTPVWSLNLLANYTLPPSVIPETVGVVDLSFAYRYSTGFPWDADFGPVNYVYGPPYSTSVMREPAHSFVNIRAEWTSEDGAYNVAAWAKNLTDTKYLVTGTQVIGLGKTGYPGAPRTFGLTVGYNF